MPIPFLYQLFASAVAVAVMVGLAAWIGIPRAWGPMTTALAEKILAEEYPDAPIDAVVVDPECKGAAAYSGDLVIFIKLVGDGHSVSAMQAKDFHIRKRVAGGEAWARQEAGS